MFIFFLLSFSLFLIGSLGLFLLRTHALMALISLELLILSININFIIVLSPFLPLKKFKLIFLNFLNNILIINKYNIIKIIKNKFNFLIINLL